MVGPGGRHGWQEAAQSNSTRIHLQRTKAAQRFPESGGFLNDQKPRTNVFVLQKDQHNKLINQLTVCQGVVPVHPVLDDQVVVTDASQYILSKVKISALERDSRAKDLKEGRSLPSFKSQEYIECLQWSGLVIAGLGNEGAPASCGGNMRIRIRYGILFLAQHP